MKSEDDPEARIRELEQPLADTARASEAGANPPPGKWAAPPSPGSPPRPLPYSGSSSNTSRGLSSRNRGWWILATLFIIGTVVIPLGLGFVNINRALHSKMTTLLPNPSTAQNSAAQTTGPAPSTFPSRAQTAPAGASLSIAGIEENRSVACNHNAVNVSGISNKVVITGHCTSLNVSGACEFACWRAYATKTGR